MPRVTEFTPALRALIAGQDGVVATWQLGRHGIGRSAVQHRLARGHWQRILPGVLLTHSGQPTRRQRVIAAQLWGGPEAAIDGACACHRFGLTVSSFDQCQVHLVAPFGSSLRSRSFIHVRRTMSEIEVVTDGWIRYVAEPMAVLVAAREARSIKGAVAVLARALQTGLVTVPELQAAREMLGDKWCKLVDRALVDVGVGLRSPAESMFYELWTKSRVLPEPLWNQWLDLGDGRPEICADGLWIDAGMIHEINGKRYHGWGDAYESTSARTERVAASGLIPTSSTPLRLLREGPLILANLERTHALHVGRGMPPGVRLVDPPAWASAR